MAKIASSKAYKAGQELFDAKGLSDLVYSGDAVSGRVRGSNAVPHTTTIKLEAPGKLVAHCTCPTFADGWEKFCHHAVALALSLRQQYRSGGEITTTHNPWIAEVGTEGAASAARYTIQQRANSWLVNVYTTGVSVDTKRGKSGREGLTPADRMIRHYLAQEIDRSEDGAHELDDAALAGLLYFGRHAQVSLKGVGKLKFAPEPVVLRALLVLAVVVLIIIIVAAIASDPSGNTGSSV